MLLDARLSRSEATHPQQMTRSYQVSRQPTIALRSCALLMGTRIADHTRFVPLILPAALKKLNVQPITGVEECNMFMENGNVLHFSAPKGMFTSFQTLRSAVPFRWSALRMFKMLIMRALNPLIRMISLFFLQSTPPSHQTHTQSMDTDKRRN